MGFFAGQKKNMQRCMDFLSQRGQNHAKSAWVFSPDEKTHAKVYGFEHQYQKKIKKFKRQKKHVKVYGLFDNHSTK
jgi:hypothetical protein